MPPKSIVWKHFDKATLKCRLCGKVVSNSGGNTTNLWSHLRIQHPDIMKTIPQNVRSKNQDMEEIIDDPGEHIDIQAPLALSQPVPASRSLKSPVLRQGTGVQKQPTIQNTVNRAVAYEEGGSRASELDDAALYMIVKNRLPLGTTESKGFRHFAKKAVPLWKPPSRGKMTRLMEKKSLSLQEIVKNAIFHLPSVCLTADCWTETHTTMSYLGATVHFLLDTKMESAVVGLVPLTESHTGDYLSEKLEEFCGDWAISKDKVSVIVTDNAENMKCAAKNVFGTDRHLPCFDHTLNLVPKSALGTYTDSSGQVIERVPGLQPLIKKIKDIVTFSHQSCNFANELKRIQIENYKKTEGTVLRLVQDVETRWNSTYLMAARFVQMADIVVLAVLRFPSVRMLTAEELNTVRNLCEILLPFHLATLEISSESVVTASKAIPVARLLKEKIANTDVPQDDTITRALKEFVLSELCRRFDVLEKVVPLAAATILDPRFKKVHFTSPIALANILTFLTKEYKKLVQTENSAVDVEMTPTSPAGTTDTIAADRKDSLWSIHDKEVDRQRKLGVDEDFAGGLPVEMRQYLNRPVINREENPFEAWESLKNEYPRLYTLSLRFLPTLAASTPSERLFSGVGLTATELRSRLTPTHLSQLIFLYSISDDVWNSVIAY